jgi:hypothetical protein
MSNTFRYVFKDNLCNGYWQPMPPEKGKRIFRISYPEHADQFGDFLEVIETGDLQSPFQPKVNNDFDEFHCMIIKWFSDNKLLSDY